MELHKFSLHLATTNLVVQKISVTLIETGTKWTDVKADYVWETLHINLGLNVCHTQHY